jgi:Lrp/AsnC family transcriptional regulator, leucine-responsive regulatory protein
MRTNAPEPQLDAIDRAILDALQADGRMSNQDLAARVHLSPSACLRRVQGARGTRRHRRLRGAAEPACRGAAGHQLHHHQPREHAAGGAPGLRAGRARRAEILDCHYVAGANDYLVRFTYRDAEDLERFHAEVLSRLPGVVRSNSMLVLRTVKRTTALRLPS